MRPENCGRAAGSVATTDNRLWSLYGAPWLQPVATDRKWDPRRKQLKQAKTVAVGCDRLPIGAHGKGRVDATSLLKRGSPSSLRKRDESRKRERHAGLERNVTRPRDERAGRTEQTKERTRRQRPPLRCGRRVGARGSLHPHSPRRRWRRRLAARAQAALWSSEVGRPEGDPR
jgi:hypothetical protein